MLEIARVGNFICGAGVILLALSLLAVKVLSRKDRTSGAQFNQVENNQVETFFLYPGEQETTGESSPYWVKPSQVYPRGMSAALVREDDVSQYERQALERAANHV